MGDETSRETGILKGLLGKMVGPLGKQLANQPTLPLVIHALHRATQYPEWNDDVQKLSELAKASIRHEPEGNIKRPYNANTPEGICNILSLLLPAAEEAAFLAGDDYSQATWSNLRPLQTLLTQYMPPVPDALHYSEAEFSAKVNNTMVTRLLASITNGFEMRHRRLPAKPVDIEGYDPQEIAKALSIPANPKEAAQLDKTVDEITSKLTAGKTRDLAVYLMLHFPYIIAHGGPIGNYKAGQSLYAYMHQMVDTDPKLYPATDAARAYIQEFLPKIGLPAKDLTVEQAERASKQIDFYEHQHHFADWCSEHGYELPTVTAARDKLKQIDKYLGAPVAGLVIRGILEESLDRKKEQPSLLEAFVSRMATGEFLRDFSESADGLVMVARASPNSGLYCRVLEGVSAGLHQHGNQYKDLAATQADSYLQELRDAFILPQGLNRS